MRLLVALGCVAASIVLPLGQGGGSMPIEERPLQQLPRPTGVPRHDGPTNRLADRRPPPTAIGHGALTPFRPASSPRELLLSFDDGPDLKGTPLILDELDRRGLKAVFFVNGWLLIGERAENMARRDLLRRVVAHGHLVGNHTLRHRNVCAEPAERDREIDENAELIAAATGVRPLVFRSPYGAHCRALEAALQDRDVVEIGWNLDPQEWQAAGDDAMFRFTVEQLGNLRGRGILLLHDSNPKTARVLPEILDWIARENQRAVRAGRPPIRILDYTELLPRSPMPQTGLEPIALALARQLAAIPAALGAW